MKLAFLTPLNPIQSGISDYSEELLLALHGARVNECEVEIDLFVDRGYKPSNSEITERFRVLPGSGFGTAATRYDATVYQMGNSPAHAYIYREMLQHKGVLVLHEFVLHHLRIWMALNGGRRREYLDLMSGQHGEEGREAARRVLLGQFPEALFRFPLSEEAIKSARGVIVHSEYMAGLVRETRPDVPLAVVQMGVPLHPLLDKGDARARLGLDPDIFLITSIGHLNPYKRVSATLRAFKALLMDVPRSLYLLIGSRSPNYDPSSQIEMLGLTDHVKSTGYVSQQEFDLYLAASDVCLNLRYPTAGETSASLLRIMGAGVPVLVSRTGSFNELPDSAAGKVDIGDIEEELLLEYLLLLARRPDLREAMSRAARDYVASQHTMEGAARGYLQFIAGLEGKGNVEVMKYEVRSMKYEKERASHFTPQNSKLKTMPSSEAKGQHSKLSSPILPPIAAAAADLGITEGDTRVLQHITKQLEGLVSDPRTHLTQL